MDLLGFRKRPWFIRLILMIISRVFCLGLLAVILIPHQVIAEGNDVQFSNPSRSQSEREVVVALATSEKQPVVATQPRRAMFEREHASPDARSVADWVVDSGDNQGMPFVIVDKKDAKAFVFYVDGRLRGAAPILLGIGVGDDAVPGIGNREMSTLRPEERTTPAGRFVSYLGVNYYKKDILWVDYDGAVSMHRVVTNKPEERRLERLATPTPLDNRISYGCINVPVNFFNSILKPTFIGKTGIVYVLPEVKSKNEVFAKYYDVE